MSIDTSGDITATVESTVRSLFSAAQTYGAKADGFAADTLDLTPPDFRLEPVTAPASVPTYTAPSFVQRTFRAPSLSGLNAGLEAATKPAYNERRAPSVTGRGTYTPDTSGLPTFAWTPPPALGYIGDVTVEAAPVVAAPTALQLPDVSGVTFVDPSNAPRWSGAVEFDLSGPPGAKPVLPVLVAPTVTVPALPAVPDWATPEEVVLSEVALPTLAPLVLPETDISVPSLTLPELSSRLDFTDEAFDDRLVQELMAEVRQVLGGRLAIPGHVWTRIWERVAADINRQYLARKREAQRAHAKLGWSMPGGVLLEAMQVAATDINAEISAKANEIAIKQAELQHQDYWQAMQQGVACTTLLSQIHNARQERLLKAAVATLEAQVTAYNAVIAAYNAEVQAISADIETKKLALQGELAKLDVFKTEMEGAKLGVEVDKARVEIYVAQWGAVKTQAEAYEALVRGVATQVEAQKAAVEAYGEQVKAQSLVVQMWATEWDAYTKKLEAEKLKLGKFEAEARVFESQVSGYRAWIEGQTSRSNVQIEAKKLELQRAQVDASRYQADWSGEQIKVAAYEAYLKGEGLPIEAGKANAEIYQAMVQGKLGEIQAFAAPYDAYTKLLQKDAVRAQLQNSYASLYGALVQQEALGVELTKIQADLDKTYEMLKQEYNKALVSEHQAKAQYEAAQLNANVQAFAVSAETYKADAQGQAAIAGVQGTIYQASVEASKGSAQMLAEGAKILTAQWQAAAQISQAQLQAAASVYAQLGSAAYAATNASLSSGYSGSESTSESVSTNYNYSMQG